MPMSTDPKNDKPDDELEEKPAPKAKAKDDDEPKRPENLTKEELEKVRRDIRRMWHPEPEETR